VQIALRPKGPRRDAMGSRAFARRRLPLCGSGSAVPDRSPVPRRVRKPGAAMWDALSAAPRTSAAR